jgi:hypothetical protein
MTYAPQTYKDARAYLIEQLDMHPGRVVHDDLDPAEVGIVGSEAHKRKGVSYHLGKSDLKMWLDPYSVRLARDRKGLTDGAAALDIGEFRKRLPSGIVVTHRTLGDWLLKQCHAGARDAAWIREVIWSPDGKTVLRYDRERGQRSAPRPGEADDSHLTHDHLSGYRDQEHTPKKPLFERFMREMGDDDMPSVGEIWGAKVGKGDRREAVSVALVRAANGAQDAAAGTDAILKLLAGETDAERIIAEIREQGEQTRAAIDARVRELAEQLAPGLAAAVAERLGVEIEASEVGEALAAELAEMLAAASRPQG